MIKRPHPAGCGLFSFPVVKWGKEVTQVSWWVYMVRCSDGSLYTGMAKDVARRAEEHNSGKGAKYTRSRLPVELVYQETLPDRSAALRREAAIKKLTRGQKLALLAEKESMQVEMRGKDRR